MKKTKVLLTKTINEILILHHQVKEQYEKNASLIQFMYDEKAGVKGSVASSKDQFASLLSDQDHNYPKIDQQILDKMTNQMQSFLTRKHVSAGGQARYVNVTQIFDEQTQNIIKNIQNFFSNVVKDKVYWNREILQFFGIKDEDIPVFLNFHQVYKLEITRKYNQKNFSTHSQGDHRLGSYWEAGSQVSKRGRQGRAESYYYRPGADKVAESGHSDMVNNYDGVANDNPDKTDKLDYSLIDDTKSFHIDIGRFKIEENYLYARDSSSSNADFGDDAKAEELLRLPPVDSR